MRPFGTVDFSLKILKLLLLYFCVFCEKSFSGSVLSSPSIPFASDFGKPPCAAVLVNFGAWPSQVLFSGVFVAQLEVRAGVHQGLELTVGVPARDVERSLTLPLADDYLPVLGITEESITSTSSLWFRSPDYGRPLVVGVTTKIISKNRTIKISKGYFIEVHDRVITFSPALLEFSFLILGSDNAPISLYIHSNRSLSNNYVINFGCQNCDRPISGCVPGAPSADQGWVASFDWYEFQKYLFMKNGIDISYFPAWAQSFFDLSGK